MGAKSIPKRGAGGKAPQFRFFCANIAANERQTPLNFFFFASVYIFR